jgi:glucose-6-phosphate isomerase
LEIVLSLPLQNLFPGRLEAAFRRELETLRQERTVTRLWAKDATLWPSEPWQEKTLKSNLGWLDLPAKMGPYMTRVLSRAQDIESEGFEDIVFVVMGSSGLAADSVLHFPGAKLGKRVFLLDSTAQGDIVAIEKQLVLPRTLFIFPDKTGKGIETHALLLYFLERLKSSGVPSAGRHFVALTERGSYLAVLASEYRFSDVFFAPPGISCRYSALIHFGLFLAVVCHIDPGDLILQMNTMAKACGPSSPPQSNPALLLSAFLAAGEIEGLDRLIFLTTPSTERVAYRIANLVGTSTSKNGYGIVPIFGLMSYPPKIFDNASMVVCLSMNGDDRSQLDSKLQVLKDSGIPTLQIELAGPAALGIELFKWEIATALACSLLAVNPFDDPDIQESKTATSEILEKITARQEISSPTARIVEAGMELFVEGELRHEVSTLSMQESFRTFLDLRDPQGYLALLPFVELTPSMTDSLRHIRDKLVSALEIPVLITPGPRYLHALGQVYKGGPAKGLFIVLTAAPDMDLLVPGAGYSFGQLQTALALGDFQALLSHQRPAVRLHFADGAEQGMLQFDSVLTSALANIRRATT